MHDVISLKGTRGGILVSFNEEEEFDIILQQFSEKVQENRTFFKGSQVSLDLGWREAEEDDIKKIISMFAENEMSLQGIISSSAATRKIAESFDIKVIIGRLGLAGHHGSKRIVKKKAEEIKTKVTSETHLIKKTLRSGQKIDFDGNVVVIGDVNPGAEVVAKGDVIVWGVLRGAVHAGSGGAQDAKIIAKELQPVQLRIADRIYLGNIYNVKGQDKIAKLENDDIVINIF